MARWDRKLVGYFSLVALVVVVGAAGVVTVTAKSATRTQPESSAVELERALGQLWEVTHEYFEDPLAAATEAFIDQGHGQVRALARSQPEAVRLAQVIFRRDLSSAEVGALAREYGLAVYEAELVILTADGGEHTNAIPRQFFERRSVTVQQAIDGFAHFLRENFRAQAARVRAEGHPRGAEMARYVESLSQGKAQVLRLGVTARADVLQRLSETPGVYALVMDPSAENVARLAQARHRTAENTAMQDVRH